MEPAVEFSIGIAPPSTAPVSMPWNIKMTGQKFDVIILDPPYRHSHINNLLPIAAKKLAKGGCIICEYEKEAILPETPDNLIIRKTYRYGKINVTIFCKPSEEVAEE